MLSRGLLWWSLRNPLDAFVSHYKFFNGWFFEKDEIPVDEFIVELMCKRGIPPSKLQFASYWHHLISWYPRRHDENVLWMHYEDMIEDLSGCIDIISTFLGIGADDTALKELVAHQVTRKNGNIFVDPMLMMDVLFVFDLLQVVTDEKLSMYYLFFKASKEFMAKHVSQFDDHVLKRLRNKAIGLPEEAGLGNPKVMLKNGTKLLPSPSTVKVVDSKWRSIVEPVTGCESYESLRSGINGELGRAFGATR